MPKFKIPEVKPIPILLVFLAMWFTVHVLNFNPVKRGYDYIADVADKYKAAPRPHTIGWDYVFGPDEQPIVFKICHKGTCRPAETKWLDGDTLEAELTAEEYADWECVAVVACYAGTDNCSAPTLPPNCQEESQKPAAQALRGTHG